MKPQFVLSVAGLLMLFAPGCCVLSHIFGCPGYGFDSCGAVAVSDGCHHSKKCDKKCRKCRECLEEHGGGYGGMMMGDFVGGGCGCGGGGDIAMGMELSGGCASCGQAGPSPFPGSYPAPAPAPIPMQMSPSSEAAPTPTSGVNLNFPQSIPSIPPSETSSTMAIPQGTQQVSVEEFQRLPGVVISGPTATGTAQAPAMATSVPGTIDVTAPANPVQQAASKAVAPAQARQVQQAGWAPVRK